MKVKDLEDLIKSNNGHIEGYDPDEYPDLALEY